MINSIAGDLDLSTLGLTRPAEAEEDSLGQQEFLQLMITQLENQDPFKPLESGEFLGQLAQFGTVSGLAELQTSFNTLAGSLVSNQALQAAALVGRSALVASAVTALDEEGQTVQGAVDLPTSSSSVRLEIRDASGQVVRELDLGAQAAGLVRFVWDGQTDGGAAAAPGRYSLAAQYRDGGQMSAAETLISAPVESVVLGARGFAVHLRGLGEVPFSAVREIGNP
ncbi:MAG TPA: flagellar hook assembly protein FlgD [Gammaproteobacteria bacterium]|nr:flagellar hook assembly protein FlgD [Gammaproteobacteria bacterium]